MTAPTVLGNAGYATANKSRVSSASFSVNIPTATNFLIAQIVQETPSSSGAAYCSMTVGGQAATARYQSIHGTGNQKFGVLYKVAPLTGTRTIVVSTNVLAAIAVNILFVSGVDPASPIVNDTSAVYGDTYTTSPALSLASNPDWLSWTCADQNRYQNDGYFQGYPSAGWTQAGSVQRGGTWNNDSDDPKYWYAHSMQGYRAGVTGSQSVQWHFPYIGAPLVYQCHIRGISAAKGVSQACFFF